MTIYIITQHECFDYCGIGGAESTIEVYNNEEMAIHRHEELTKSLGEHSGLFYSLSTSELNKKKFE